MNWGRNPIYKSQSWSVFCTHPGIYYDIRIPVTSMISNEYLSNTKDFPLRACDWTRNGFKIYWLALEFTAISSCAKALPWNFDIGDIKGNRMKLFC